MSDRYYYGNREKRPQQASIQEEKIEKFVEYEDMDDYFNAKMFFGLPMNKEVDSLDIQIIKFNLTTDKYKNNSRAEYYLNALSGENKKIISVVPELIPVSDRPALIVLPVACSPKQEADDFMPSEDKTTQKTEEIDDLLPWEKKK